MTKRNASKRLSVIGKVKVNSSRFSSYMFKNIVDESCSSDINFIVDGCLEEYHIPILVRMYRKGIIMHSYKSIKLVEKLVGWSKIKRKYSVNKKFKAVIRKLVDVGLVTDSGKSYKVCSLTPMGVKVARLCEEAFPSLATESWKLLLCQYRCYFTPYFSNYSLLGIHSIRLVYN